MIENKFKFNVLHWSLRDREKIVKLVNLVFFLFKKK